MAQAPGGGGEDLQQTIPVSDQGHGERAMYARTAMRGQPAASSGNPSHRAVGGRLHGQAEQLQRAPPRSVHKGDGHAVKRGSQATTKEDLKAFCRRPLRGENLRGVVHDRVDPAELGGRP
jgi:hypothetical protein